MIKKLAFAAMALYSTLLSAEELRYENQIFDTRVKTVVLTKAGTDDRYPIIALNSNDQLELSFDILGNKNDYFQYTLIHCDANWNPTSLGQNEYLRGLTFDNITDFKYSTNTYVKYVHYNLLLPNENMKPIFAGNYLIKVYRNFDEEELVLTRRMMILNPAVSIDGVAKPATLAQHRFTKQEVGFSVNYRGSNIPDPYKDVNVVLMQNGQWDNTITGLKPLFIRDNTLDYN
ncbi:MAG: type IX secretion system plug protein domain-containing protein, partial [Bacteroidia bacterium]